MAIVWYKYIFIKLVLLHITIENVRCPIPAISELSRYMDYLCPYNVICRSGEPTMQPRIPGFTGCCTDCSCEDTCGLTEDCCFPSMDTYKLVDRSHQECTKPSTVSDNLRFSYYIAYNMVVDGYPDGEGSHCGDDITTKCGDNENATAIGSLYPVFSKRTGRIYKNIECAKCHGVHEEKVTKWKVWLACDDDGYKTLFPKDVMSLLHGIATGKLPKHCGYEFEYPGPKSDIRTEQCIAHPVSTCNDEFNVFDLNLTREEIREQCSNGVYSPFKVRYKNIFCYICSEFVNGINPDHICVSDDFNNRISVVSFAALVEPELYENRRTEKIMNRRACIRDMGSEVCRDVYCPAGQVNMNGEGCGHISKQWDDLVYSLNIKLVPHGNHIKESLLYTGSTDFGKMLSDQSLSPWPNSWLVMLFIYTTKPIQGNEEAIIDHFLVKIEIRKKRTNINAFLVNIEQVLRQDWYLYLNGSLYVTKQMLSEFTKLTRNDSTDEIRYTQPSTKFIEAHEHDTPTYKELMYTHLMPSLEITKLFFCEQIQLTSEEYEIDFSSKSLFYIPQNRVFFLGEFYPIYEEGRVSLVRICIEDSPFQNQLIAGSPNASWGILVLFYTFRAAQLLIYIINF